jgi:DNA-binding Xre family transcriptional regulator
VTVVETGLLLVEDVLHLPAADAVTTRLAGMRDVTEIMTDVTVTVIASVNATGLAAQMIVIVTVTVTVTSKKIVTNMRTASVAMMSATLPRMVTTEKVSLSRINQVPNWCFNLEC